METVELYWMERSDHPKVNGTIGLAKLATAGLLTGLVLSRFPAYRYLLTPLSTLELIALELAADDHHVNYYQQLEETFLEKGRILPLLRGLQLMTIYWLAREIRASCSTSYWGVAFGTEALALTLTPPSVTAWRAHREAYLEKEKSPVLFGKWLGAFPREKP